jgi:hypothetical protein
MNPELRDFAPRPRRDLSRTLIGAGLVLIGGGIWTALALWTYGLAATY